MSSSSWERLRIASNGRITQKGGDLIIDNTNNGYGGLRIVDDSGGDYTVNYIAGRNQGATAHVFKRSGRTQGTSPWANSGGDVEFARISRGGIAFGGDTASNNTLDDYEEGSWTPNWAGLGNGSASGTYTKIGNLVHITAVFTAGSTTNIGTKLEATNLPFTCVQTTYSGSRYENYQQNSYIGATRASGSQLRGYVINTSGTQATEVPVSSSQPFTWGNQDYAQLAVTYRTS